MAVQGIASAQVLDSGISRRQVEERSYLSYTVEALDNLMQYGTDRYGSMQSPLLVSVLDVRTKEAAIPDYGDTYWRADQRFERRSPQGVNFLQSQPLYRTMYKVSELTGDNTYAIFANSSLSYATTHLVDDNGMFYWGWHRWYDVVADEFQDIGDTHEMHFVTVPEWERMWSVDRRAVHQEISQIWNRHVVNPSTGQVNRHDDDTPGSGDTGVSFIMTSASFIEATAFLSTKLPGTIAGESDPELDTWLERSLRLASYPYNARDPVTNLVPHIPYSSQHAGREDQFMAFTTMHLLAQSLMKSYEHTGEVQFLDQAITYLTAYDQYGYDHEAETYWGAIHLDGTPDTSPRTGPLEAFPTGHIDFWQPNAIDREFPAEAAQSYAHAYALTGDPAMLTAAERWAKVILTTQFDKPTLTPSIYSPYSKDWAPLGTYAEHYGRVIDFFLSMYDHTGEEHYLLAARDNAQEAISTLYYEGLFRGHPNKPYYEELDGVPLLLEALAQLDGYSSQFTKFGDFDGNGVVDLADYQILRDNWLTPVDPYRNGDLTGDGFVSLDDFSRFKLDYFEGPSPLLADPLVSVPEPGSLVLLSLAIAIAWRWRRGRIMTG